MLVLWCSSRLACIRAWRKWTQTALGLRGIPNFSLTDALRERREANIPSSWEDRVLAMERCKGQIASLQSLPTFVMNVIAFSTPRTPKEYKHKNFPPSPLARYSRQPLKSSLPSLRSWKDTCKLHSSNRSSSPKNSRPCANRASLFERPVVVHFGGHNGTTHPACYRKRKAFAKPPLTYLKLKWMSTRKRLAKKRNMGVHRRPSAM
ncbi:hypothetical protein A0H81_08362 [Grifola frondosa]|uniref:Uncharacterized protein n=1 Tax=Grifola frondosa TaxID=5627 RepID=A0A1C7M2Y8_GRIFR|nr:hypothetical protein A0H81_08362 [Grifola frondosa]